MKLYHVITNGVHPNNRWTRRPDGLYDLSGSAYAFDDEKVRECTARSWSESCGCTLPEHEPRWSRTS
jgi:hypothetical protein